MAPFRTHNGQAKTGFVKLLSDCTRSLGILGEPHYETVEHRNESSLGCTVTIRIGPSIYHPGFSTTTLGHIAASTQQTAARDTLRRLCTTYEKEVSQTCLRFFPPDNKTTPLWQQRLQNLAKGQLYRRAPIVNHMTNYLLTLDHHFSRVNSELYFSHRQMLSGAAQVRQLKKEKGALRKELDALKRQNAALKGRERAAWDTVRRTRVQLTEQKKKTREAEKKKAVVQEDRETKDVVECDWGDFPPISEATYCLIPEPDLSVPLEFPPEADLTHLLGDLLAALE